MSGEDEELQLDLDGNILRDPDNTWEFYGTSEACSKCSQIFELPADLMFHEPCYDLYSNGMFKCPAEVCIELFSDLKSLRSHYNDCHEIVESFYCSLCKFSCVSYEKISMHKLKFHAKSFSVGTDVTHCDSSIPDYNVSVEEQCDKLYLPSSTRNMDKGKRYQVICGMYLCDECHKSFKTVHELVLHEPCFLNRGSFTYCPECCIEFEITAGFQVHLEKCHDDQIFVCCQCNYKFKKEHEVREHLKVCNQPAL